MEQVQNNGVVSSKTSILLLILLLITVMLTCIDKCSSNSVQLALKKQVIEQDITKKIAEGHYSKIINDLNSEKQVSKTLKSENKQLYDQLKKDGKKPLIYTSINTSFKGLESISDVGTQSTTNTWYDFKDYYPSIQDPFITYTRTRVNDSVAKSNWNFNDIKLDLVVSETANDIFKVDFKGPEFLKVNSIKVNSIPLSPIIPDNFDWLGGAGALYNPNTMQTKFIVSGGIRYKSHNIILQSTGDFYGASYLKSF